MGEWPCGSWDITVGLKALLIADTRLQGGDTPIYVVQVGEAEGLSPATMARLASRLRTRTSNASSQDQGASRWARVSLSRSQAHRQAVLPQPAKSGVIHYTHRLRPEP